MPRVFISYRRSDEPGWATLIYEKLKTLCDDVYFDVKSIEPGANFREHIHEAIDACDALVAVIGSRWLGTSADSPRLFNSDDYVRAELESALGRDIPVFPILVGQAAMPAPEELPNSISGIAYLNAIELHPALVDTQIANLIQTLKATIGANGDLDRGVSTEARGLLEELRRIDVSPERRVAIGDRLAQIGDLRSGVGLDESGLPDICWRTVPAGSYRYGHFGQLRNTTTSVDVAKYPITNAQFQSFIDDGGYRDRIWWREHNREFSAEWPVVLKPSAWGKANRPRNRVSWLEARAFCRWYSQLSGTKVDLIQEQVWEKAARGSDARLYPWGDEYVCGYANVNERIVDANGSYLNKAIAVGLYPHGTSPFGIDDMIGNVWEMCYSADSCRDRPTVVLRGGSWMDAPSNTTVFARKIKVHHGSSVGFRVCRQTPVR